MSAEWRRKLLISSIDGDGITVTDQASPPIRPDLLALFERSELEKYLTEDELVGFVGTEE
jgi:succinate dehydrogenase / fumarate reductase flavoprotein subunit